MRFSLFVVGAGAALVLSVSAPTVAAPLTMAPPPTTSAQLSVVATDVRARPIRMHSGACARRAWFSHQH